MSSVLELSALPSATTSWSEFSASVCPPLPILDQLAPAERIVACYLRQGLSNREIASALGKSEATVKNQVSACLHKLAVPTRGRLIALLR